MTLKIKDLGKKIVERRGADGVRAAAKKIGIPPATLSRIENGHVPDLEKFAKICTWLGEDPNQFLGFESPKAAKQTASVHMRKKNTTTPETAIALGAMIIAVQDALAARDDL
jgi:transcriptional regulator with XRE-family HTH domain